MGLVPRCFFSSFPTVEIRFWSILLGYVWVRTFFFFFTFLRPLGYCHVCQSQPGPVKAGVGVSVQVGMPTYLNPFLEYWVISTCSTERRSFLSPFLFFVFHLSCLSTCPLLDGLYRVIILARFLLHAVGVFVG